MSPRFPLLVALIALAGAGGAVAADTAGPVVSLRVVSAKLDARGSVRFAVVCPIVEQETCRGLLELARGGQTLGSAPFGVEPGDRRVVRVWLTQAAIQLIERSAGVRAAATATVTDRAGNVGRKRVGIFLRPHKMGKKPH